MQLLAFLLILKGLPPQLTRSSSGPWCALLRNLSMTETDEIPPIPTLDLFLSRQQCKRGNAEVANLSNVAGKGSVIDRGLRF